MAKVRGSSRKGKATSANVGYEAQLWQMADALRGSMDAAEYKRVVLGLIFFLKYVPSPRCWSRPSGNIRTGRSKRRR
jgi:type I restriction enzyme M protein